MNIIPVKNKYQYVNLSSELNTLFLKLIWKNQQRILAWKTDEGERVGG